ncbi:MAG: tellurite resistance TerB family protein [Parvibaculales bacterium]
MTPPSIFTIEQVLVQLMLTTAAADGPVSDVEIERIERLMAFLPVFENLSSDQMPLMLDQFSALMSDDQGLDALLETAAETLPENLHETAYALAVEIAAADLTVQPEEIRFLELLRDTLKLEKLAAAAIERGARARFALPPS